LLASLLLLLLLLFYIQHFKGNTQTHFHTHTSVRMLNVPTTDVGTGYGLSEHYTQTFAKEESF
jgi:hypothetical protein